MAYLVRSSKWRPWTKLWVLQQEKQVLWCWIFYADINIFYLHFTQRNKGGCLSIRHVNRGGSTFQYERPKGDCLSILSSKKKFLGICSTFLPHYIRRGKLWISTMMCFPIRHLLNSVCLLIKRYKIGLVDRRVWSHVIQESCYIHIYRIFHGIFLECFLRCSLCIHHRLQERV